MYIFENYLTDLYLHIYSKKHVVVWKIVAKAAAHAAVVLLAQVVNYGGELVSTGY